jgi:spore germination protein GerM
MPQPSRVRPDATDLGRTLGVADVKHYRFAIGMVAAALLIAGCSTTPPAPVAGPGATQNPTPSATPTPAAPVTTTPLPAPVMVRVYFDSAEKMQPVLRSVPAGTKATLRWALAQLLSGPDPAEADADLATLIPAGTTLRGVSISGKTATVDLSSEFESGGGSLSMTNRLAQLVFTATQFSTVTSVKLKLDGKAVTVFGGEGIMIDHPMKRSDFEGATPAIFVDQPAWNATIRRGQVARGTANVFEAVFRIQVRDANGALVLDKTVHATSGTGTRGSWSAALDWAHAKSGAGELRVFAASPKDGKPIEILKVPVTIAD